MATCPLCEREYEDAYRFCPLDGVPLVDRASAGNLGPVDDPHRRGDPYIGRLFGRYRIVRKIGSGGMGMVFAAEHEVLKRDAAVKILHPHIADRPEFIARFFREAQVVNEIGHRHIVDIFDLGTTDEGITYCVMELIRGRSLLKVINSESPLSERRILHIAVQMTDALSAAHDTGVVHRDLKPENVLIERRGDNPDWTEILDFGVAKLLEERPDMAKLTKTGMVVGSAFYMSPEQITGEFVDHRTDIYAMGLILFEMATGLPPFGMKSVAEALRRQLTEPPPSILEYREDLSDGLRAVVARALDPEPQERYQSMWALRDDLQELLEQAGGEERVRRRRRQSTIHHALERLAVLEGRAVKSTAKPADEQLAVAETEVGEVVGGPFAPADDPSKVEAPAEGAAPGAFEPPLDKTMAFGFKIDSSPAQQAADDLAEAQAQPPALRVENPHEAAESGPLEVDDEPTHVQVGLELNSADAYRGPTGTVAMQLADLGRPTGTQAMPAEDLVSQPVPIRQSIASESRGPGAPRGGGPAGGPVTLAPEAPGRRKVVFGALILVVIVVLGVGLGVGLGLL